MGRIFQGDIAGSKILGAKCVEEHIPEKRFLSPIIKVPLKTTTDQEPVFRIDIKYFRQ